MNIHKTFLIVITIFLSTVGISQNKFKIDSLRNLVINVKNDSVKVDLYNELSKEILYSNKDTAQIYAIHGMEISKACNYNKGLANSYLNIGNISNLDGNFSIAIEHFLNALDIFLSLSDSAGIANSYSRLGMTHYFLNNPDKSLEYNTLALLISERINKKEIENIYNSIGLSYMLKENTDSALYYFEKSIIKATDVNNKSGVVYSYGNIANIYLSQEKFDEALKIYLKVEELCLEINDKIGLSVSAGNISLVYGEMAEKTESISDKNKYYNLSVKNAQKSLEYAEDLNSLPHKNFAYNNLTSSYKGLKDYKKAFEYAEKYISTTDSLYNINKVKEIGNLEKKYKTEQQKLKIQNITKEKELKEDIIKKQDQIILIGVLGFFLIIFLMLFLFILYRNKKSANKLLNQSNEAIKNQRSEIASQRDHLSELAFELKKSNKTKSKFFSILAHDLKNPFQSLLGFSELLKDQAYEGNFSNTKKYSDYIFDTTNRTYSLLENLLNWSKVQTGALHYNAETLNLSELINESIEINRPVANAKNIEIINNANIESEVFADKYMISTIFRNLISNAVKFTKTGGKIFIDTFKNNNFFDISIRDTGVGIKEENLKKIFKLDQTISTKGTNEEKGTGLGLVVCKEFAAKNNGILKVDSVEGKGSTFTLSLPTKSL